MVAAVVEDEDFDGEAEAADGFEFLEVHHDAAVAGEADDALFAAEGDGGPEGGGDVVAHGGAAGVVVEALAAFYDGGFLPKSLPGSATNVEIIRKEDIEPALKNATRKTETKGEYHKINHGAALLALIDPAKVEKASPHAASFHQFLRSL